MIGFSLRYYDFSICSTYIWVAIHALRNAGLTWPVIFFRIRNDDIVFLLFWRFHNQIFLYNCWFFGRRKVLLSVAALATRRSFSGFAGKLSSSLVWSDHKRFTSARDLFRLVWIFYISGNPLTVLSINNGGTVETMYDHHLISIETYKGLRENCNYTFPDVFYENGKRSNDPDACNMYQEQAPTKWAMSIHMTYTLMCALRDVHLVVAMGSRFWKLLQEQTQKWLHMQVLW